MSVPQIQTPPEMIRHYGQSLTRQDRSRLRAQIGILAEALLDGYWQNRPSEVVKQEIMRDWMDALDAYTEVEFRAARRMWMQGALAPPLPYVCNDLVQVSTLAVWQAGDACPNLLDPAIRAAYPSASRKNKLGE